MKIQKTNLKWNGTLKPLDLRKVNGIALHHMAHPTAGIQDIHRWHINNGWVGFGYNYWIDCAGNIYEGRGLNQGAAVSGFNDVLISIGFQGDYDVDVPMPKKQFDAGVWLIEYLKDRVTSIRRVEGHRFWNSTSCPGKHFPLKEMIDGKMENSAKTELQKEESKVIYKTLEDVPSWGRPTIQKLVGRGSLKGDGNGNLNLSEDLIRTLVILDREGVLK